jgi:hypothetical protein
LFIDTIFGFLILKKKIQIMKENPKLITSPTITFPFCLNLIFNETNIVKLGFNGFHVAGKMAAKLSNGHSPQIRENGELLVRMWRGESHFSQKWRLANVGESGEYSVNGLANVGEFGESAQHGSANVGEFGESAQHGLANVGESGESAQHGSAQAGMIR